MPTLGADTSNLNPPEPAEKTRSGRRPEDASNYQGTIHVQLTLTCHDVARVHINQRAPSLPKVTIVFFDAGGGHRNAANAIRALIEQQSLPWRVELANLQELLDDIDPLHNIGNLRLQDGYNLLLRKGWTRFSAQMLAILHGMIRVWHAPVVRRLRSYWSENPADLIVSVIPNLNRALTESIQQTLPQAKFVTVLTDFADHPPHFWIERESQFLICGTDRAVQQAAALGQDRNRIFRTSGMVLHPKFYEPRESDRAAGRARIGLEPDWPTALVSFGGHGSPVMLKIAQSLCRIPEPLQTIFICGHNDKLAAALRALPSKKPMFIEGFTQRVSHYMSLSDFFIGKPGPGSIAEALHFGLPVIVECNARTLPQERYNAQWVRENEVGILLDSFGDIHHAVLEMLAPARLDQLRNRVAAHRNRAVYEVVDVLKKLMSANREVPVGTATEELASL